MARTVHYKDIVKNSLSEVRKKNPLVHNVTNFVAMNLAANALLAVGASPIMAHALNEMTEIVDLADSVVLNQGTLDPSWCESMKSAASLAKKQGKLTIFDPVGVACSSLRREHSRDLMNQSMPSILRANASEVLFLAGQPSKASGVDSRNEAKTAISSARLLADKSSAVVCMSGATDCIVDPSGRAVLIMNGDPLMASVTAMGCVSSSIAGAFAAVHPDPFEAAVATMVTMGVAGEIASCASSGPGSFVPAFLDALHALTGQQIETMARVEQISL